MINEIESIRKDILKFFDSNELLPEDEKEGFSPDGKYFFRANSYKQTDPERNWTVARIEIFQAGGQKLFEFIRDEDLVCCCWLNVNDAEYFICPEDFEGQSIYDLTNDRFYSFASQKDPFIWTEIVPSPDKTKLAVIGCYWACPFELVIYDISDICRLPYPVINRKVFETAKLKGWKDNETVILETKGENRLFKIFDEQNPKQMLK
jgi:hypothetical protein